MRCPRSIASFVVAFLTLAPTGVLAAELSVPSRIAPDLSTALDLAVAGDVIVIAPSYTPQLSVLTVSTSLTLRGASGLAALPPLQVVNGAVVTLASVRFDSVARLQDMSLSCEGLCITDATVTGTDLLFEGVGARVYGGSLLLDDAVFEQPTVGIDADNATITLIRPTFTGASERGIVGSASTVWLVDAVFTSAEGPLPGVDLSLSGGSLQVLGASFFGGSESAISLSETPATLNSVVFDGYSAVAGAAIHAVSGTHTTLVIDGLLAHNLSVSGAGGVVWTSGVRVGVATLDIQDTEAASGGAFSVQGGSLSLAGGTVAGVHATGAGGVVVARAADVVLEDIHVVGDVLLNTASGGVVAAIGGSTTLRDCSVVDVYADVGGVVSGTGLLTVLDLHAARTHAMRGGVVDWTGGQVTLIGLRARDNEALVGTVLTTLNSEVHIADGRVVDGVAGHRGAGLVLQGQSSGEVRRMRFCGNESAGAGSAVLVEDLTAGTLVIENNVFVANHAATGGPVTAVRPVAANTNELIRIANNAVVEDDSDGAFFVKNVAFELVNNVVIHSRVGMVIQGEAPRSSGYNVWFGNAYNPEWATTDLSLDPGFMPYEGPLCDAPFFLSPTSTLRDAGDPTLHDPDGSRSDIGAFGGAHARIPDADHDGIGVDLDCDDTDPSISPQAYDQPYDGIDQDCDGSDSCDVDGDGSIAEECGGPDCDDTNADIAPSRVDSPYDGIDQDCDGMDLVDADGDGWSAIAAGGADCDDGDPTIHPQAVEIANDDIDQDCDGYDRTAFLAGGGGCDSTGRGIGVSWAILLLVLTRRRRA